MLRVGVGLILGAVAAAFAASNPARTPDPPAPANRAYTLKLGSFVIPPSLPAGLVIKARIDGGPPLRLLLDSGAQSIVLGKRAAGRSGHSNGSVLDLIGLDASPRAATRAVAHTVEIGDLVLRDCEVIIVNSRVLDGVDGVIPLSLFSGFLVRLDIPGKTLDLQPYPEPDPLENWGLLQLRGSSRDLLFVRATLNGSRAGNVLVDTGAFYSAISEDTERDIGNPTLFAKSVPLQGGAGSLEGRMLSSEVRFRLGSHVIETNRVVVVGLGQLERYHQMDVAGILGYTALRNSVLTVNYRERLLGIEGK